MADDVLGVVVHAADLHLGAPLDALTRHVDDERATVLRQLATGALDRLVDLALHRAADAVVLSGDVYDGADREVGAQLRFGRALRRLTDAGIRVFVAHGNHDPVTTEFRPAMALPDGVTVFQPGPVQVHQVHTRSGGTLHVAGVSFSTAHEHSNLAARFADLDVPAHRCVAVLHANVEGTTGHDPYAPCSEADLERAPVAYWALGHVHRRTVRPLGPGRWWAYPGNLQGRSTKSTECGPKGALVVTLRGDGVAEPEFVACDGVRFVRLDVDVTTADDVGGALDLLDRAARGAVDETDGRPVLVRARFVGASLAHHALLDAQVRLEGLAHEHLAGVLDPGALVQVRVATRPSVDRQQLLGRGDLTAALLQRLDVLRASDEPIGPPIDGFLDPTTSALLGNLDTDPDRRAELLDRVEQLLVDRLVAS